MGTNKKELVRGLKYELAALPLLVAAPILITIGFKAIKQQNNYLWLVIGVILAITAIILGFWGIRIILNAFFNDK
jgi:ABC-type phosphate transport system permease subunit